MLDLVLVVPVESCSSPGSFLMVEVDYLVKAIGCYKCRCVLCSSLHLLSPQYPNSIVIGLDVDVFILFSYHCCFSASPCCLLILLLVWYCLNDGSSCF